VYLLTRSNSSRHLFFSRASSFLPAARLDSSPSSPSEHKQAPRIRVWIPSRRPWIRSRQRPWVRSRAAPLDPLPRGAPGSAPARRPWVLYRRRPWVLYRRRPWVSSARRPWVSSARRLQSSDGCKVCHPVQRPNLVFFPVKNRPIDRFVAQYMINLTQVWVRRPFGMQPM
jgi:hypothetical protein